MWCHVTARSSLSDHKVDTKCTGLHGRRCELNFRWYNCGGGCLASMPLAILHGAARELEQFPDGSLSTLYRHYTDLMHRDLGFPVEYGSTS